MPKGKGHRFSPTEDMLANEIAKEYEKKGYDKTEARSIGYATVVEINKNKHYRKEVLKKLKSR